MSAPPDAAARAAASARTYRPVLFRLSEAAELAALRSLQRSGEVVFEHDTLRSQLEELVETRFPGRRLTPDEMTGTIAQVVGDGGLDRYGTWVYYPWSGRLVRVLPAPAFEELRTSRNRHRITRDEQTRLARLRVGVVGLSVGGATAAILALEGVGGTFRLADFDGLGLSNMNRLLGGVHAIGVHKGVLTARQIFEVNPYAQVEVFEEGVRDENLSAFFSETAPLDLLFDECDDLAMKVRLRLEARRRRVPVLMATSDRGMFDLERFDREPERGLLHGLVDGWDPDRLSATSRLEQLPLFIDLIGQEAMSRRGAASLIDIGTSLNAWPQLASAVALASAINTDAARRVALGQLTRSGRYRVDLEEIVADEAAGPLATPAARGAAEPPVAAPERTARIALDASAPVSAATLEELVRLATLAPSHGNRQPWRFTYARGVLSVWLDEARARSVLDVEQRGAYTALGAAAENLRLGAGALGVGVSLRALPDPAKPTLVYEATFGGAPSPLGAEDAALAAQIESRVTNRRAQDRVALPLEAVDALRAAAAGAGAEITFVADDERLGALAQVVGAAQGLRIFSRELHREMMGDLRWTMEEASRTRDGIDVATLELTPVGQAVMRLLSDWSIASVMREVGAGKVLTRGARSVATAGAMGLLCLPGTDVDPRHLYLRGGAALQRVWLTASKRGLAFQPIDTQYLFTRSTAPAGVDEQQLSELRRRYHAIFGLAAPAHEIMLFRIAAADSPTARSLRRPVGEVLSVEAVRA